MQKLSAMRYIKNNKRKVSVLIVSLTLCFVLTYISKFLLSTTTESFRVLFEDNTERIQYIQPSDRVFGLNMDMPEAEHAKQYSLKLNELMSSLKAKEGIYNVFPAEIVYTKIQSFVGQYYLEIPLTGREEVEKLLEHMNAVLEEGRLPENNMEIVLCEELMKNSDYKVGDCLLKNGSVKIVGMIKCDYYFGCGIYENDTYNNLNICVLSDGTIDDFTLLLNSMGYKFDRNVESIIDKASGGEEIKDVEAMIDGSTNIVYVFILIVLFIVLLIVYTTYLRDRQNEWCLYSSIGYSKRSIYFSIIRELLFTFAVSLLAGGIIIFFMEIALDYCMIKPAGNRCRYFQPDVLMEILCSYVLLFGMLQIPIRYEIYRIRTIDALDDDLN